MRARFALLCGLLLSRLALATSPEAVTDTMSDDELRTYRATKVAELSRRSREAHSEKTADGTAYSHIFFCTVYYTPKESGFTAERGFDVTPATAAGLGGRTYPRSFLNSVKKEGFGRIVTSVGGRNYIQYVGGRFRFARAPLGSRGNVLVPRKSCAISTRNKYLRQRLALLIASETVDECLGSRDWEVADTGGGIHPLQIDLYYGEDEPRGPVGRQLARPRSTWMEYSFETVVTAKAR
jgi:hypothetical protein